MNTYLILLRGINVGGNGKVPMADLKKNLTDLGFSDVATYIASGNVIAKSNKSPTGVQSSIESMLQKVFGLSDKTNKVLVLTPAQLQAVVDSKPNKFGEQPELYYSDAIFLMGITAPEVMAALNPKEGVDKVWPGPGVVYSQRLGALRTKSRLNRIMSTPLYHSMTIRSWNTTTKLLELVGNA